MKRLLHVMILSLWDFFMIGLARRLIAGCQSGLRSMIRSNKDKWIRCRASDDDLRVLHSIQRHFNGDLSQSDIIRAALRSYALRLPKHRPQTVRAHEEQLHVDQSCL